jgi:hypothetical protein
MQVKSIRVDDGKPIEMTGQSVEVVRQQFTGEWLLAVDHPFGAA